MNVLSANLLLTCTLTLLTACGSSTSDRVLSGAGLGAGAGAVGGAVLGGNPLAGAAVGAAVGGAAGGLTNRRDVDLGSPLWR